MSKKNVKSLAEMNPGESGVVTGCGDQGARLMRLFEMGLLPGTGVRLVRRAPLGDPLEIELRGYALSLRTEEARVVNVAIR